MTTRARSGALFVVRIILQVIDFFWEKCQNNSRIYKQEGLSMMYMHFCKRCNRIHILNGHKINCPGCSETLVELAISFHEFSDMNAQQRADYQTRLGDEQQLAQLQCVYRAGHYRKNCGQTPVL